MEAKPSCHEIVEGFWRNIERCDGFLLAETIDHPGVLSEDFGIWRILVTSKVLKFVQKLNKNKDSRIILRGVVNSHAVVCLHIASIPTRFVLRETRHLLFLLLLHLLPLLLLDTFSPLLPTSWELRAWVNKCRQTKWQSFTTGWQNLVSSQVNNQRVSSNALHFHRCRRPHSTLWQSSRNHFVQSIVINGQNRRRSSLSIIIQLKSKSSSEPATLIQSHQIDRLQCNRLD